VRQVIREIIDVWSGVCDIYFSVPKNVFDATRRSTNVAESFVEIIREAVSNAIKHGGAKEIEVSAKLADGVISLQVTNDGKKPSKQQANTGYGTQILNELALSWSVDQNEVGKVVFTAEIVANL
jgi:signal transduction histidine kinase